MSWLWWAPLAAAGLHITEEFALPGGFGEWDRAYRPAFRRSITPGLHVVVNVLLIGLCVSVALSGIGQADVLGSGVRIQSVIPPAYSGVAWIALAGLLFSNAWFHVVGTFRGRRYSPGVVTGVLLYIPLAVFGMWHFVWSGRVSPLAAVCWGLLGASYPLWAGMAHRLRARGRRTKG